MGVLNAKIDVNRDLHSSRIDVGVLVAHSPGADVDLLRSFAERMTRDGVDKGEERFGEREE